MTKKQREEPKFRIDDLEEENRKTVKKQWPIDEEADENEIDELEDTESDITGILDHPSYKELENRLTETEKKANEYWNQHLRTQAELENVRRRAERDVANAYKYSVEKLISELLPVIDSLERALESKVNENEYAQKIHEGIELTMSLFLKVLEKFGVTQINPEGELFNPELHQAISAQPATGVADNTILSVLQKGFILNDRLLRPALVVVAKS